MMILFLLKYLSKQWIARPNNAEQYIIAHNPKTVVDVELISRGLIS